MGLSPKYKLDVCKQGPTLFWRLQMMRVQIGYAMALIYSHLLNVGDLLAVEQTMGTS